jgi:hypothetical protein
MYLPETAPSEKYRCNSIYGLNGEWNKGEKGMQGINQGKKRVMDEVTEKIYPETAPSEICRWNIIY